MPSDQTRLALYDIRENGKLAQGFVAGLSFERFGAVRFRHSRGRLVRGQSGPGRAAILSASDGRRPLADSSADRGVKKGSRAGLGNGLKILI
jgi:hypothetical protein